MIRALLDVELLSNRADANSGGGVHPTALYNAAKYGKMEVVEELIGLGAQVNVQGGQYNTALSVAAISGYFQIAQFLLDWEKDKADPNLPAGDFANTLCAVLYFQTACDQCRRQSQCQGSPGPLSLPHSRSSRVLGYPQAATQL